MKCPSLFHKKINCVFTNAEVDVEPCARAARSQVLWAGTAAATGTPGMPDTSQANWHLQPLYLPQMPLPTLTLFTKKKKKGDHFHSTKLMWPGVGARKKGGKSCPLFIYFNRTRQNSLLLEINIKPSEPPPPLPKKPTALPLTPSSASSPSNIVRSTKDHITNASCGSFRKWPPSRR